MLILSLPGICKDQSSISEPQKCLRGWLSMSHLPVWGSSRMRNLTWRSSSSRLTQAPILRNKQAFQCPLASLGLSNNVWTGCSNCNPVHFLCASRAEWTEEVKRPTHKSIWNIPTWSEWVSEWLVESSCSISARANARPQLSSSSSPVCKLLIWSLSCFSRGRYCTALAMILVQTATQSQSINLASY